MANEILISIGTSKSWKQSGGDYALSLNGLTDTSARQGAKGDLGTPFAEIYVAKVQIDHNASPTDGELIQIYWAASPNATAGTDNPGETTGADAAYSDPDNDAQQLDLIGNFFCLANTDNQIQNFFFRPKFRYGMPVVWNNSGQTLASAGNSHIEIHPYQPQYQTS